MSFHKRRYNWELIKDRIRIDTFIEFDNWIFKPEAHILQDQESSDFFKAYCSLDDHSRELLFECLKKESEDFLKDIIKCINVVTDKKNQEIHMDSVGIYVDLFIAKWDYLAEKYKSLIQIK